MSDASPFRSLPPVNTLLDRPEMVAIVQAIGRDEAVRSIRRALDEARAEIAEGRPAQVDPAYLVARAEQIAANDRHRLRPVINATGVLLNTGLGRAPIAGAALDEVARVSSGYSNLEFDLDSGRRGDRTQGIESILRDLTGAEAATVVNNNAAATVLTLRALAIGREVVVSRGQLIEIGGSFRLPEIFESSGARLREVGTTNKTRLGDYARAIGPETAALMRVHPSNYQIVGFTESVEIGPLVALAHERGIVAIDDIGSGLLDRGLLPDLVDEPTVRDGIDAGADVVLFSADKLLGGPQAGIIVGSRASIGRIKADPLMRAFRVDKMTLAALETTLSLARRPPSPDHAIPLWRLLATPATALETRASQIAGALMELGYAATVEPSVALLGGGSDPMRPIDSRAIRLAPPYPGMGSLSTEADLARSLRVGEPAVVARVQGGAVVIDLRSVFTTEDDAIVRALRSLASSG